MLQGRFRGQVNTRLTNLISAFLLLASIQIFTGCANGDGSELPGDKREWSILQGVELQTRGKIKSNRVHRLPQVAKRPWTGPSWVGGRILSSDVAPP